MDESEYKGYLDLNLVRYTKDLQKDPAVASGTQVKSEDNPDLYKQQIKQLTAVNLQQKAQIIEALVNQQTSPQLGLQPPTPASNICTYGSTSAGLNGCVTPNIRPPHKIGAGYWSAAGRSGYVDSCHSCKGGQQQL